MNILINFSTLKSGGGQNVGLNFISTLDLTNDNFFFLVANESSIHRFLYDNGYKNFVTLPNNPIFRIIYEILFCTRILKRYKINVIYSYFGYGFFSSRIPQIIGAADSNLFFPDIDFWKGYRGLQLLKRKLIDKYRVFGLKNADGIIFENELLETKCHQIYKVKAVTTTIKPSINLNYATNEYYFPVNLREKQCSKGLFLCGWHLNKNIMLIPEIAYHLKMNHINFHFILTAHPDNSFLHKDFELLIDKFNVKDMISIVGAVKKDELNSLYNQVDFVFLLSKLESFSNNIIESWSFKRLLIVSDEPWARALCGNAALYVNRDSPELISNSIINVLNNSKLHHSFVNNGIAKLSEFPKIIERVQQEINFVKKVYGNI